MFKNNLPKDTDPVFIPPHTMSPGEMGYFYQMVANSDRYSDQSRFFTANIISMALSGHVFLKRQATKWLSSEYYVLIRGKKPSPDEHQAYLYNLLFKPLFLDPIKTIELKDNFQGYLLKSAIHDYDVYCNNLYNKYFVQNRSFVIRGTVISVFFLISSLFIYGALEYILCIFFIHILLLARGKLLTQGYTDEGWKIYHQIDAFRTFLKDPETSQQFSNAPKIDTKLYEAYIPYAIALGVNEEWTYQCKKITQDIKPFDRQTTWFINDAKATLGNYVDFNHLAYTIKRHLDKMIRPRKG